MVFPLPLAVFEEYMVADDRAAYPMSGFIRLRFAGRFDRAALEQAQREAFGRHPLLAAKIERSRRGRYAWVMPPDWPVPICWVPRPVGDAYPPRGRIDLEKESGVQLVVAEDDAKSDLIMHLHHASCDGLGGFQFFEDLLMAYAEATGAPLTRPIPPAIPVERLLERGTFGLTWWKFLRMLPKQLVGLQGVSQFLKREPISLAPVLPRPTDGTLPDGYPASAIRWLEDDDLARLKAKASQLGVTSNDVLVRDLFLTMEAWRLRHFPKHGPGWLRLSIPMNLRGMSGLSFPAANVVSMVFLDRRPPMFDDPEQLLHSVHDEMQLIKRMQLGLTFIFSLLVGRIMPGGIAKMVRADRCSASCVLSNFGTPLAKAAFPLQGKKIQIGNLLLESADALPPLRPFTCTTLTAITCSGRMSLALHYDPPAMSAAQAEDLVDSFVECVRKDVSHS
jgi:NRPS condensation-like uncharacterized protein